MEQLIPHLREYFDRTSDRLRSFHRHGVQVEGWLKGELLLALDQLKERSVIRSFDREVRLRGKRIDLAVDHDMTRYLVELKHWTSDQKGKHYDASWYFRDRSNGIDRDVEKLELRSEQRGFVDRSSRLPGALLSRSTQGTQGVSE